MTRPYLAATLLVLAGACSEAPPAVPIRELMMNEVQPTAETYWNSVRFESELVDGEVVERDIRPRSEADWQRVAEAAERLGELGERLQADAYTEGRGADWTQFAQGLTEVAGLAKQAAAEKNPDKVFSVGGTIYNVCSACHQVYPPAAAATPAS